MIYFCKMQLKDRNKTTRQVQGKCAPNITQEHCRIFEIRLQERAAPIVEDNDDNNDDNNDESTSGTSSKESTGNGKEDAV